MQKGGDWNKEHEPWAACSMGKGKSNADRMAASQGPSDDELAAMELPRFDKMQGIDYDAKGLCETSSVCLSGQEYGNPGHKVKDTQMPDLSRVSVRTTAE
eukprot:8876006-Karenia_brevis.AAC.1